MLFGYSISIFEIYRASAVYTYTLPSPNLDHIMKQSILGLNHLAKLGLIKSSVTIISLLQFSLMTIWDRRIIKNATLPSVRTLLFRLSVVLSSVVDWKTQSALFTFYSFSYSLVPLVCHCTHFSFQILSILLATLKLHWFMNSHALNNVSVFLIIILLLLHWPSMTTFPRMSSRYMKPRILTSKNAEFTVVVTKI